MSVLPGPLGVVRAELAPGHYVTAKPQPRSLAVDQATELMVAVAGAGGSSSMVSFDRGDGFECWIRAAAVLSVDVVPTEDPGAEPGRP